MRRNTKPTILLVDDNPQIRSFIRPALEDNGFKWGIVYNPSRAMSTRNEPRA